MSLAGTGIGMLLLLIILLLGMILWRLQIALRGKVSKNVERVDLVGQTFCVTGGNRGIGFETARTLLSWGGTVVLGVRDVKNCEKQFQMVLNAEEMKRLHIDFMDLASFKSIQNFVTRNFLLPNRRVHCLINNAHHSGLSRMICTEDQIEYSYQVNYLSHCLLTFLLLPHMKFNFSEPPARIVHVGSRTHVFGKIRKEKYGANHRNLENYNPNEIYPDTKLMQLIFSQALTSYFHLNQMNIASFYVHPGGLVQTTNCWIRGPEYSLPMRLEPILMRLAGTRVNDASRAVVNAAIRNPKVNIVNSEYIVEGNLYFDTTELSPIQQFDTSEVQWLWENTLELIEMYFSCSLLRLFSVPKELHFQD